MYKTILVPLDGSELAEAILPHVEELARLGRGSIIFVQIIEIPHLVDQVKGDAFEALPHMTAVDIDRQMQEARHYLDTLAERVRARGVEARGLVEYGPVVATILRIARQESAALIAMASHGRGGLADVYYGSVAAGILQRIDRPLLIVRAQ